jgi:hypothetical protein
MNMTDKAGRGVGVMAGHGYYAGHSTTQSAAAARGLDLLRTAAAGVDLDPAAVVRIADLGCAQGHNSLAPVAAALAALRERTAAAVDVVHTDLPSNDWTSLFAVIEHAPDSYLTGHRDDVHPSVVGRSFYERLFASATISLAWTSSTLHWLSASPGPIADHFFVQSSTDHAAVERYRARARRDWTGFLAHRAVELVPSGSIVLVDVLMGDDGAMGSEALFDTLEAALRAARDRGRITADEYTNLTYPTWFRTLAELRAPFDPVFAGPDGSVLELVALEPATLTDPFRPAYEASHDADAYGRHQADFLRGFLGPSFRTALSGRSDTDRNAILDAVFADAAARIATDPAAASPTYRLVTGHIRRAS